MAMGVVSNDAFDKEVSKHTIEYKEVVHGRGNVKAVDANVKEAVAIGALLGSSNDELAEEFGLSLSSISAYKNGANSTATYHEKNDKLQNVINDVTLKLQRRASDRLDEALEALDLSDPELKARDISAIAKDMSIVYKNLEPEKDVNLNVQNNRVLIYRPRMKEEEEYDVIEVAE